MDIHRKSRSVRLSEKSYEMLGAVGAKSVPCGLPSAAQPQSTRINRMQTLWNCPLCTSSFLMMVGAVSGFKLEFMHNAPPTSDATHHQCGRLPDIPELQAESQSP